MASWVQAVFSVVAIIFASFIPWLHELSKERRSLKHARRMLALLSHRQGELFLYPYVPLYNAIGDFEEHLVQYLESGYGSGWKAHRLALDNVSMLGLSAKELSDLVFLRTAADYALELYPMLKYWEALSDEARRSPRTVKTYMEKANRIYSETGIVSDQEL